MRKRAERRKRMNTNMSIEQLAAYFDGNLTMDDSQIVSAAINQDAILQDIVSANDAIEETMRFSSMDELSIPNEILCMDFELPKLDANLNLFESQPNSQISPDNDYLAFDSISDGFSTKTMGCAQSFVSAGDSLSQIDNSLDSAVTDSFMSDVTDSNDDAIVFMTDDSIM